MKIFDQKKTENEESLRKTVEEIMKETKKYIYNRIFWQNLDENDRYN